MASEQSTKQTIMQAVIKAAIVTINEVEIPANITGPTPTMSKTDGLALKHPRLIRKPQISIIMPGDYDSFAMAIFSQNHREIDITESILVSINVTVACAKVFSEFPIMMSWGLS